MYIKLENNDVKVFLLSRGATIYQIQTKNKEGRFKNIVLSHKELDEYENGNEGYFGSTCGRVAGRIRGASFKIDDELFELSKNDNSKNTLHGGFVNLSKVDWTYIVTNKDNVSVCIFKYMSKHLEEGFPGDVEFEVKYTLKDKNLVVEHYAHSNRKTYINLTNHSYFNLSDIDQNIYNHKLQINSDRFLEMDIESIPINVQMIEGSAFDFRKLKFIGNITCIIDENVIKSKGFNHALLLNKNSERNYIYLLDEVSKRSVTITTSYPCVVVYTYNEITNTKLLDRENVKHAGIALELQYQPNEINEINDNIIYVDKNNPYYEFIKYEFNC